MSEESFSFKIFLHRAANVPSAKGECKGAKGIITIHIFHFLLVTSFAFIARECIRDYNISYISLLLGHVVRLRHCSGELFGSLGLVLYHVMLSIVLMLIIYQLSARIVETVQPSCLSTLICVRIIHAKLLA